MRTVLAAPKAVTELSPMAREVIKYSNFLLLGFKIDLDDLPAETVCAIEYFGMKRRQKEESERFKALQKILGAK